MTTVRVSEVFRSVQGEGRNQGRPCAFVRLHGCDMRCDWCDTMHAVEGEEYHEEPIDAVLEEVEELNEDYVCVTGGEPLRTDAGRELVHRLVEEGYEVDVETNGAHPFRDLKEVGARIVMDVKPPSSGEESDLSLLDDLGPGDDAKFVVGDDRDYDYAKRVLETHDTAARTYVQPVGGVDAEPLVERVLRDGLPVTVQVQLHRVAGIQ